jgi:hypothetical protein
MVCVQVDVGMGTLKSIHRLPMPLPTATTVMSPAHKMDHGCSTMNHGNLEHLQAAVREAPGHPVVTCKSCS